MSKKPAREALDLLFGARALAGYIYGDEERWRSVYALKKDLALFRLRGQICGRRKTIDARITKYEQRAIDAA